MTCMHYPFKIIKSRTDIKIEIVEFDIVNYNWVQLKKILITNLFSGLIYVSEIALVKKIPIIILS